MCLFFNNNKTGKVQSIRSLLHPLYKYEYYIVIFMRMCIYITYMCVYINIHVHSNWAFGSLLWQCLFVSGNSSDHCHLHHKRHIFNQLRKIFFRFVDEPQGIRPEFGLFTLFEFWRFHFKAPIGVFSLFTLFEFWRFHFKAYVRILVFSLTLFDCLQFHYKVPWSF